MFSKKWFTSSIKAYKRTIQSFYQINKFSWLLLDYEVKAFMQKMPETNSSKYRPILLPPLIFKIIETTIHEQLVFLTNKKLLHNFQTRFRKNHSTDSWLKFLRDKVLKGFNKGLMNDMMLNDLQKAFDKINHVCYWKNWELLISQIILLIGSNYIFQINCLGYFKSFKY